MNCRLIAGLALACASLASAQTATLLASDTRHADLGAATDVVFVAEGWAAGEEAEFLAATRAAAQRVEGDPAARPLLPVLRLNWHYVFVPSAERPSSRDGAPVRRSACGAHVREDEVLIVDDARAEAFAARAAPDVDCVVTFIRFERGGARANVDPQTRCVRLPEDDPRSLLHELGHALMGVGDEYSDDGGRIPADRAHEVVRFPNLTTDPTGRRWAHIVPTAFEGGGGWRRGVYHPERSCRMRTARSNDFCRVCLAQLSAARVVPQPELVSPREGARLSTALPLRPAFRLRNQAPVQGWYLDLYAVEAGGYRKLASRAVEGQDGHTDFGALPAGRYLLGLSAHNLTGTTPPVWVRFQVEAGAPSTGSRGLTAALGGR